MALPRFFTKLLFSLCCLSTSSSAQLSVGAFLLSSYQDSELKSARDQLQYLETRPYRLSPVRRLEFRTRSNQLDPDRQDYALRLNPASPWEMKRTSRYYEAFGSTLKSRESLALKEALLDRYELVIQWICYQDMLRLKDKAVRLAENQASLLERQQSSDMFKGDDFVSLKVDQMEYWAEREEINYQLLGFKVYIEGMCPEAVGQSIAWQDEPLVSVERVGMLVDSLAREEFHSDLVALREKQVNLADEEYALEKSNVNVGYLQAQYESYRLEQEREPWNLSLGITIPVANPNKADMTKRRLEAIDARQELEETRSELSTEKRVTRERLGSLLSQYREIGEKLRTFRTGPMLNTLSIMEEGNPVTVIRYYRSLIKLETTMVKLKQSILSEYIKWLASNDRLHQKPLVNYLSENLLPLE